MPEGFWKQSRKLIKDFPKFKLVHKVPKIVKEFQIVTSLETLNGFQFSETGHFFQEPLKSFLKLRKRILSLEKLLRSFPDRS